MKKPIAIASLLILVLNFTGFYLYFIVRAMEIHQEQRALIKALDIDELTLLKLSAEDYEKCKWGEDEIEVNAQMYDIARVEKSGSEVYVYCLADDAEDNLLSLLDQVLKNSLRDKKQIPAGMFSLLITTTGFQKVELPVNTFRIVSCFTAYAESASTLAADAFTPPPRAILA